MTLAQQVVGTTDPHVCSGTVTEDFVEVNVLSKRVCVVNSFGEKDNVVRPITFVELPLS